MESPDRRAGRVAAVFALGFALLMGLLLARDWYILTAADPMNSPRLAELKIAVREQPGDTQLREDLRDLDLRLRQEYFRRRQRLDRGGWVLLGSLLIAAGGWYWARRGLAGALTPPATEADGEPEVVGEARLGVLALAGAVLLTGGVWAWLMPAGPPERPAPEEPAEIAPPAPISPEQYRRNWPRFRGPGGLGIVHAENIPTEWDGAGNRGIRWKVPVPLPGMNSPVVWEDRIFLTGATATAQEVYCFAAADGRLLWRRQVRAGGSLPTVETTPDTGFAAATGATDGRRFYAIFASGHLAAFDFAGNQVWDLDLGVPENPYGHASSLTTWGENLIVLFDQGHGPDSFSSIMLIDGERGQTIWETDRDQGVSWSTPIVARLAGRDQVLTNGMPWTIAYDAADGAELWRARVMSGEVAVSPVVDNDTVFVTNEGAVLAAIRPDGEGDVTETHVLWQSWTNLPSIVTPLAVNGRLWQLANGYLTCHRQEDGEVIYEEDLIEPFSASPCLVGDRIYLLSEKGTMLIIGAGDTYEELGRNELGEACFATPAFTTGRLFIRGVENLYCIETDGTR